MKKVFFVALVAALGTATVNAQFEKGVKTLNVKTSGLDLKTYSVEGNSETKLNLAAEGSYFIIDQLAIAAEVGVESLKEFGDDEAITTIFLGAGARYYLSPKGWFAGARLVGYGGESRISAVSGIMEGGYTWYIRENLFIEPALQISKDYSTGLSKLAPGTRLRIVAGFGVKF